MTTTERPSSSVSSSVDPPSYDEITAFMARTTAKLPASLSVERGILPYEYNGCDYALAFSACFPAGDLDLRSLSWGSRPLAAQLHTNLSLFCEAARRLGLPDAPMNSLHPSALQPCAACVVHHIKVQHWLYSLSRRFPPDTDRFDPVAVRLFHSWQQLGAPFLTLKRTREEADGGDNGEDGVLVVVNDPDRRCTTSDELPCLAPDALRPLRGILADTPPYTEVPTGDASGASAEVTAGQRSALEEKENISRHGAAGEKPKPWQSYSKPWRLPAIEAANARRARAEEAAAKRREAARQADPTLNAFAAQASNLRGQYTASEAAATGLADGLTEVKNTVLDAILEGQNAVDYMAVANVLRRIAVRPDV